MNLIQSFMGCMYPVSISTESIESIGPDNPELRFQASNIDEDEHEQSRGELQLTDKDLIYSRPCEPPIRWPINCIRRYGCSKDGQLFTIHSGRTTPTGEAIIAFRVSHGSELVELLKDKIERTSPSLINNMVKKATRQDHSENMYSNNNNKSNAANNDSENIIQQKPSATASNIDNNNFVARTLFNPIDDQSTNHNVLQSSTRNEAAKATQINSYDPRANSTTTTKSETSYTDTPFATKPQEYRQPASPTRSASTTTTTVSTATLSQQATSTTCALSTSRNVVANSKPQPYSDINMDRTRTLKELAQTRHR